MRNLEVIYIVGVGRSGTSMLMTLLNGHSKIAFTPETHFLRFYMADLEVQKQIEAKGVANFRRILEEDTYFQRLNISAAKLLKPYQVGDLSFKLDNIYHDILQQYLQGKNKQIIGDKDPRYLDYLEVIKRIYPKAKVIHIHRDVRDVVLSKTKAKWAAHRPFWLNAVISQVQMKEGRQNAKACFGENYYELAYEDLVSNPNTTLTKLLGFLGLDFEEKMLDSTKSAQELVDESEMQWKDNTFQPILHDNTEKWRSQLTPFQIRTVEIICKEWFSTLGYSPSMVSISGLKNAFLKFMFRFEGLQAWLYRRQLKRQLRKFEENF